MRKTTLLQKMSIIILFYAQFSFAGDADKAAVIAVLQDTYPAVVNAGDAEGFTNLFTPGGERMPPNRAIEKGHTKIGEVSKAIMGKAEFDISATVDHVEVSGETAWATGFVNGKATIKETGKVNPVAIKFLFVLEKQGDEWKVARHIWNKQGQKTAESNNNATSGN